MTAVFSIVLRELDHLLHAIGNLHTDHGLHGYLPPTRPKETIVR